MLPPVGYWYCSCLEILETVNVSFVDVVKFIGSKSSILHSDAIG